MKRVLIWLAVVLALSFLSFGGGYFFAQKQAVNEPIVKTDTVYKVDTFVREKPVPYQVSVIDTQYVQVRDTTTVHDTLFMALPREQKTYKSEKYTAVISGIFPSLDYIETYNLTTTVTNTVVRDRSRFGLSIGAGPGVIWSPFKGLDAGIGVFAGVTYTFDLGKDRRRAQ